MTKKGCGQVEWAFHGTSKEAVKGIAVPGFLPPPQIDQSKVLDSGFFGHGISMTYSSDYALYYSNTRGSNQMLLCQILLATQSLQEADGRQGLREGRRLALLPQERDCHLQLPLHPPQVHHRVSKEVPKNRQPEG